MVNDFYYDNLEQILDSDEKNRYPRLYRWAKSPEYQGRKGVHWHQGPTHRQEVLSHGPQRPYLRRHAGPPTLRR